MVQPLDTTPACIRSAISSATTDLRPTALDLSYNHFSGAFPQWVFTALSALSDAAVKNVQLLVAQQADDQLFQVGEGSAEWGADGGDKIMNFDPPPLSRMCSCWWRSRRTSSCSR